MMKVKTNRVISYGGKEHPRGAVIDMDDKTAKVNIANRRVSQVHSQAQAGTDAADKGDKGRHKRRDMRAEDDSPDNEGEA
jgi:hypothetical protein